MRNVNRRDAAMSLSVNACRDTTATVCIRRTDGASGAYPAGMKTILVAVANMGSMRTHGEARRGKSTPEYRAWKNLCTRALNPNTKCAGHYFGREISVCREWAKSYPAFLAHVGRKPSPEHTIERIDNDRGYEPGNVKWATRLEQCRNQRSNVNLTFNGRTQTLTEWASEIGLSSHTLYKRVSLGMPVERVLFKGDFRRKK